MLKKRKGYNIIELLVVITAISLITAIGYKGFNILFDNIKTEGVKTEFAKIKTALAKSQAVGNIYWGGDIVTASGSPIHDGIVSLSPLKEPDDGTTNGCHYGELYNNAWENTCSYTNILAAERELFLKMEDMEFRYVGDPNTGGNFRSSQFPTAKIGFLPNMNGFAGIIMTDIPGNIAKKLYEDVNSPKWDPIHDGKTSDRPLIIFDGGTSTLDPDVATDITFPNDTEGFTTLLPSTTPTFPDATSTNALDVISTLPKVTLVYIYTFRKKTW